MKESLPTYALNKLVQSAGSGTIEVHKPLDLQTPTNTFLVGTGAFGAVYKATFGKESWALKVLGSMQEDQKIMRFRREIALMRYVCLFFGEY
jgi:hypothetical protein